MPSQHPRPAATRSLPTVYVRVFRSSLHLFDFTDDNVSNVLWSHFGTLNGGLEHRGKQRVRRRVLEPAAFSFANGRSVKVDELSKLLSLSASSKARRTAKPTQ